MSFADDLTTERTAEIRHEDVQVILNGNLHTLRFLQLAGGEWVDELDKHPARPGVLIDTRYGYNLRTLVPVIAKKTGRLVESTDAGDRLRELSDDQWDDLFRTFDGSTRGRIDDAIFLLNEVGPLQRVNALKKGSAAASGNFSE